MTEARLFALQRITAMLLGPMVLIHLAVILYAVRGGLTAQEILARTSASALWPLFYLVFVVGVAIHAPIGLRNVLREWTALPARAIDVSMIIFAGLLALLGLRAVYAVAGWGA